MALIRKRGKRKPVGDVGDPQGMGRMAQQYFEWMGTKGYSEYTISSRKFHLRLLFAWCEERGLTCARQVTKPILERYQRHLYHYRKANGQPLTFRVQRSYLQPVQAFFKWLTRSNRILYNPAAEMEMPKVERRLPRHILSADEAEQILNLTDITTPLGVRDRAMLETLYSTGIRRMELSNLDLYSLDLGRGTLMVRQGKGRKDRLVPIGERAAAWIDKYRHEVRPLLVVEPDCGALFLSRMGEPMATSTLTSLVNEYVDRANIGKTGSCHLFRHTMATLMLDNGADIRFIQAMLGHTLLDTTQMYTQVSIRKLKEIHTLTHPAQMGRTKTEAAGLLLEADDTEVECEKVLAAILDAEQEGEEDGDKEL